ncbi:MAG: hypothetical protein V3V56_10275 [bacterium]
MKQNSLKVFFAALPAVFLLSCAGPGPPSWRSLKNNPGSISGMGRALVAALEADLLARRKKTSRRGANRVGGASGRGGSRPLKVIVAAFASVPTGGRGDGRGGGRGGGRTGLSRRLEDAVRRALERSPLFSVIDSGEGVPWQEAGLRQETGLRPAASAQRKTSGKSPRRWARARAGPYGEGSAVYAASMLGAEAAVFGAYAPVAGRIRVWGAAVLNAPPRRRYFERRVEDIFGVYRGPDTARTYVGVARGELPRGAVPKSLLSAPLPPRPRKRPRHPARWASPAIEVVLERIDPAGRRVPLIGGESFGAEDLIVGRVGASTPRYVYGFALDRTGRAEEILAASGGGPTLVRPGREVQFTARLLPAGRPYRVYFVSSAAAFDPQKVIESAASRLGISAPGRAQNFKEAAAGAPERPWFVLPGQERLILRGDWDQHTYWFRRGGEN